MATEIKTSRSNEILTEVFFQSKSPKFRGVSELRVPSDNVLLVGSGLSVAGHE